MRCYVSASNRNVFSLFLNVAREKSVDCMAEADVGMFSMFGKTGASAKRGPHKSTKMSFFATSQQARYIEIMIRE